MDTTGIYAPPPKISRPYYLNEPLKIPLKAVEQLPDPRHHKETLEETTSTISELDHTLSQELEAFTKLSELDHMLRHLETDETALTQNPSKETIAWPVLDSIGTTTID